jgi:hypothetical protein
VGVASVAASYLVATLGQRATTTVAASGGSSTAQFASSLSSSSPTSSALVWDSNSTVGASGLELSLSINATRLTVGQSLWANISLYNTLPQVNSIPANDDWALQGIAIGFWPDCFVTYDSPVGAAQAVVLPGYYTMANISSVANSTVGFNSCHEFSPVFQVIFQPSSSQANLVYGCCVLASNLQNETSGPYSLSTSFTTDGYWDSATNSQLLNRPEVHGYQNPVATAFGLGVYTIAVADCWGQAVILHFEVTN